MVAKITKRRRSRGFEWFVVSKKSLYRILAGATFLLIVGAVVYALMIFKPGTSGTSGERSARFLKTDGKVTVRRSATSEAIVASPNMPLEPGDTIQTSSDSSALVEYQDGSVYNIKPGSTIIFKEESTDNNLKRVEHVVKVGQINVKTPEQGGQHRISLTNTNAELGKNSEASFNTDTNKDAIVVSQGNVKATTQQGTEMVAPNQRIDIAKDGIVKRTDLPLPPIIEKPQNAMRFLLPKESSEVQFIWQSVANADHYKLEISPVPTFPEQALVVNRDGIGSTKYNWLRPIEGSFYWRVRAITKEGIEGNWGDTPSFWVKFQHSKEPIQIRVKRIEEISFHLVTIQGTTKPGVLLTINEKQIQVDSKGEFKADISFPRETRERTLLLEAVDSNGNSGKLRQIL
jgi:hypothetical protein